MSAIVDKLKVLRFVEEMSCVNDTYDAAECQCLLSFGFKSSKLKALPSHFFSAEISCSMPIIGYGSLEWFLALPNFSTNCYSKIFSLYSP